MAEHTPGPWIASRDPANRRHWIVYAEKVIGTPGYSYRPAIARTANWFPSDSEEEEAANAELIASAPGMANTVRTLEAQNAALKAELAEEKKMYERAYHLFCSPCEDHSGDNTPPFDEFLKRYAHRCTCCVIDELAEARAMIDEDGRSWLYDRCPECGHRFAEGLSSDSCPQCDVFFKAPWHYNDGDYPEDCECKRCDAARERDDA